MGQGGYLHAEFDGAGFFAPIKMHRQHGSVAIVHFEGFEKKEAETMKARPGPTGSIKTIVSISKMHIICALWLINKH
jgi:hypothetical protein